MLRGFDWQIQSSRADWSRPAFPYNYGIERTNSKVTTTGKRPEAAGVLKAGLRQVYEGAVTGELVTRLRRMTEAFVATCAERDEVISGFARFLEGVTETDVASPMSLGTHVKAERIAQFIRDIAASPEDVERALDVLHWQLPGS